MHMTACARRPNATICTGCPAMPLSAPLQPAGRSIGKLHALFPLVSNLRAFQGCTSSALADATTLRSNSQITLQTLPTDVSTGFTYGNPNQQPPPFSQPRMAVGDITP